MSNQQGRSPATAPAFGLKLREGRLAAKLTQEATAVAVGVRQSTVSAWETGDVYPTVGKLVRLAELYRVDLEELVRLMASETGEAVPA